MADVPTASTPTLATDPPLRAGPLATLGWAAYLACSWTWCIGMFLPVLLVRDYGVWGFVVFAVPNVLGAAAMGWVLSRSASEAMMDWGTHRLACNAFSTVTMAFQGFFLVSLVLPVVGKTGSGTVLSLIAVAIGLAWVVVRWPRAMSAVALATSAALLASVLLRGEGTRHIPPGGDPGGLIWLAPVCTFGFALCPYLDLTFHRARQQLDNSRSRAAFTLGFGVLFLAMILGTLVYVAPAVRVLEDPRSLAGTAVALLVGGHLATQLLATVTLHKREQVLRRASDPPHSWKGCLHFSVEVLLLTAIAVLATGALPPTYAGLTAFEVIYRVFMAFYGLVFPAYVWLCMIPTADGHSGTGGPRGRLKLGVLGAAVALAAPCYWMGFIERREWWLGVGLGVVLLARLLVRARAVTIPS